MASIMDTILNPFRNLLKKPTSSTVQPTPTAIPSAPYSPIASYLASYPQPNYTSAKTLQPAYAPSSTFSTPPTIPQVQSTSTITTPKSATISPVLPSVGGQSTIAPPMTQNAQIQP